MTDSKQLLLEGHSFAMKTVPVQTIDLVRLSDPLWDIYCADREYAQAMDDPLLGTVAAPTKEDAEQKARRGEFVSTTSHFSNHTQAGYWAVLRRKTFMSKDRHA